MDAKMIMKAAHKVAKDIASYVGDYEIAYTFALRQAWDTAKRLNHRNARRVARGKEAKPASVDFIANNVMNRCKAFNDAKQAEADAKAQFIFGVPTWIIRKNAGFLEAREVIDNTVSAETVAETEKAVQVKFNTYCKLDDYASTVTVWVPKSVLAA